MSALASETISEQTVGTIAIRHLRFTGGNGARVPAHLFEPRQGSSPRPAVIVQHGANTSKDDFYIQAPARR